MFQLAIRLIAPIITNDLAPSRSFELAGSQMNLKSGEKDSGSSIRPPIDALQVAPQSHPTTYPSEFASVVDGRTKRRLGNHFGLVNFGVNLTTLDPKSSSSLQHYHRTQDEFLYVMQGNPTLLLGENKIPMSAGQCVGFPKNQEVGHCIVNDSEHETVILLEVGDRSPNDVVHYPGVDMMAESLTERKGGYRFLHLSGTPYET